MFKKTATQHDSLDEAIDRIYAAMEHFPVDSKEYAACTTQLARLLALKDAKPSDRISKDVLVTAAAHILGIGMIVNYERAGIITSKALGFVSKLR